MKRTPTTKQKPPTESLTAEIPLAFIKLEKLANGNVKVTHSQGIKQVVHYQSMDCSFGLSVEVAPENVHRAGKLLGKAVQELLVPKVREQSEFLQRLGAQNH